ncbi:RimJ/RimL family protein N-acetyltransferase [Sediminihabitans luteus]|uniref:RimJ/RimL family protein N-acetyltransferase n=1 Tax=Sediminihabitans luteus TaxID=1138585 RepID=A0A2M9CRB9_9CELL|nr:GNAT family N-acetyltransferase [Sediminihabitans luteus]PJJ74378.1 RimJ/RimL family protein N-acetyltransferase [Sediminihabitans luteus]
MEPFVLTGDRVRLSVPTPADVDEITRACRTPEIQRWTVVPSPYERADAVRFVDELCTQAWAQDTAYTWAVRDPGDEASVLGMVGLHVDPATPAAPSAEIGYWLAPEARGRGLMSASVALVLDWGFDPEGLGLHRALWHAYVGNWASRRVAWRVGFRVEGTVRAHLVQRGERRDAWVGTLLAGDPREPVEPWVGP